MIDIIDTYDGPDAIHFEANLTGTITLAAADIDIKTRRRRPHRRLHHNLGRRRY
jgi:hypothetical protein